LRGTMEVNPMNPNDPNDYRNDPKFNGQHLADRIGDKYVEDKNISKKLDDVAHKHLKDKKRKTKLDSLKKSKP
jgi:hypothetical protein